MIDYAGTNAKEGILFRGVLMKYAEEDHLLPSFRKQKIPRSREQKRDGAKSSTRNRHSNVTQVRSRDTVRESDNSGDN